MLKYGKIKQFNPRTLDPLNIDRLSLEAIPANSNILEIGCATGFAGEYLIKEKGCKVDGVELRRGEALIARKKLIKVILGDIEDQKTINQIKKKYDIVYSSALVEHLKDPWTALKIWKNFLKKDGLLVITTSNIAHWSMRLELLKGNFNYKQYGLLDNTHLRFFTYNSFKDFVEDCGYIIVEYKIDPVGGGSPKISKFLSNFFPALFAYQLLVVAKLK